MAFGGIMVIGLAMNLLGGIFRPRPMVSPAYMNSLSQTMAKHSADLQKMWEPPPSTHRFKLDFEVPEPPEDVVAKFEQMQQQHESERMAFLDQFHQERNQMKEEFFEKNHYLTQKGPDGKEQVVLKNGKPVIVPGKETPAQKVARHGFEATQKAQMFARHAAEKQQFVATQKQQLMTFLDSNKFQLHNPAVQSELSKLIMESKKKALNLQREHEEEFYKIDLPLKEMHQKVEEKLAAYRRLEEEHRRREENSPEAKVLAEYQQDLVALLDAKRAEARERKKAEMFLQDPRKMLKNPPKQDLATVLPMNLVVALEAFGINQLPA